MLKPGCTMLLNISRGLKTAPPATGAVIKKKLNKENKLLFGDLLETQKERRKNINNDIDTEEPKQELQDAERKWHMKFNKSGPQFRIKVLSRSADQSVVRQAREENKSTEKIRKQEDWNLKYIPIPKEVKQQIASYNEPKTTKFKKIRKAETLTEKLETHNSSASVPSKNVVSSMHTAAKSASTSTSLLLPDSVIRNITSFPMLNMEKSEHIEPAAAPSKESLRLYPSVSKVLNATMSDGSRAALKRWRTKLIEQLGEDGFLRFYRDSRPRFPLPSTASSSPTLTSSCSRAHHTLSSHDNLQQYLAGQLQRGTQFHSLVHSHLSGQPPEETLDPEMEGCWSSLVHVLPYVSNVLALESPTIHSQLLYRGILDCVASFNDQPVVIEWKKSDKPKPLLKNTYDAPLQMTAYLGAMNFDPSYNLKVNGGVVVVAYSDGSPAEAFHLTLAECTPYWQAWLARLQQFWLLQQQAAATPDQPFN